MKIFKDFEVVRQAKPSRAFPCEKLSKHKVVEARFATEQEARNYAVASDNMWFGYEIRERIWKWVRKSGFTRDGIPVHNIEVRETISLRMV